MEEQRISRMYLAQAKEWVQGIWDRMTGADGRGSNLFPLLAIVVVVVVPVGIYVAHRHARFHFLEQQIQGVPQVAAGPRPGGRDPMVLTRTRTAGGTAPEFLSATLLPGLGMDVLQITAYLPGQGEVQLLASPTVQQVADTTFLPGGGVNDAHGAVELPWSGPLEGLPNPIGTTQTEVWMGKQVTVPSDVNGRSGVAEGGMLRTRDADTVAGSGATGSAMYGATDFDDHWFSKTQMTVSAQMEAASLVLTVVAKNVGDVPEPMGIGWHPRFAILGGRRGAVTLKLPVGERLEYTDRLQHSPSGKVVAADAGVQAFLGHAGVLGTGEIDASLVGLKTGAGEAGPVAELRDAGGKYGLRLTAVSPEVREMRVFAPADQSYVSVGPQTNYDNPLGKAWAGDEAIKTLAPGQSMEWKVRLEIFGVMGR